MGDPDRCNVAERNLVENGAARSGLPTLFSTDVLLERRAGDGARFLSTFTIRGCVDGFTDAATGIKRLFGIVPRDDPIIFNPQMVEEKDLGGEGKDEHDEFDMFGQCKYVMFKTGLDSAGEGRN